MYFYPVEMQAHIRKILTDYWGYSRFRPMQEEIILSVLNGKDTLALLPTGGGKSLTFQLPALAREGMAIVVTPLIALMKDQVENARRKGIKAYMVHSGMSAAEIDNVLNNCIFDKDIKLLYVSPERLGTSLFRSRLKRFQVNLLAIDEAHCISQWGYDFRPSYLKIAEIREFIPDVPVLAVTATATPEVTQDIMSQLLFRKKNVFQQSFFRENLHYCVINAEDKYTKALHLLKSIPGTAVIYVRNRRRTVEIAQMLQREGMSALYYHAGLPAADREKRQEAWIRDKFRIMVATNAFGMGIDKPDVRLVIHLDIPDSLEAYFQEAGRGGRDLKESWAYLVFHESDIAELRRNLQNSFPPMGQIAEIYNTLGNYFELSVGYGEGQSFEFDFDAFVKKSGLNPILVFNALNFLEKEDYIVLSDSYANPSRVKFTVDKMALYKFQIENPAIDPFVQLLLRSFTGLFTEYGRIDENLLASRMRTDRETVVKGLKFLMSYEILDYIPASENPRITFVKDRLSSRDITFQPETYQKRKEMAEFRVNASIDFALEKSKCRSKYLLEYFGEQSTMRCGYCDVCLTRNNVDLSKLEMNEIIDRIKPELKKRPMNEEDITSLFPLAMLPKVSKAVHWLLDNGKIRRNADDNLEWK